MLLTYHPKNLLFFLHIVAATEIYRILWSTVVSRVHPAMVYSGDVKN